MKLWQSPEDGRIYHQFAIIMDQRKDPPQQIDPMWQRAVQASPNNANVYHDWALYLCDHGRLDDCLSAVNRARQLNAQLSDIYGLTATVYFARGDFRSAWNWVKQARQHGEKIPDEFIRALSQKMPEPK